MIKTTTSNLRERSDLIPWNGDHFEMELSGRLSSTIFSFLMEMSSADFLIWFLNTSSELHWSSECLQTENNMKYYKHFSFVYIIYLINVNAVSYLTSMSENTVAKVLAVSRAVLVPGTLLLVSS